MPTHLPIALPGGSYTVFASRPGSKLGGTRRNLGALTLMPVTLRISLRDPAGWGLAPCLAAWEVRFAGTQELPAFQSQEMAEWRLSQLLCLTPKPRLLASLSKEKVLVSKKE